MDQIDQSIHYYKQHHTKVLNDIAVEEAEVQKIDNEIGILNRLIEEQKTIKASKVEEFKEIQKLLGEQNVTYKSVVSDVRSLLDDINRKTSKNMRQEASRKSAVPNRSALKRQFK
ncbi:hypothetical protein GEMRC1_007987 [Eukaryota sp. GEM-RC1]